MLAKLILLSQKRKVLILILLQLFALMSYSQEIQITNNITNFLWLNFQNQISIKGFKNCDDRILTSDNGTIKKLNDCNYIVTPNKIGRANYKISTKKGEQTIFCKEISLKVKEFPMATSSLSLYSSGEISKNILLAQTRIDVNVLNFDIDIHYKVISYEIMIIQDNKVIANRKIQNGEFNQSIIPELKSLKTGDMLLVTNIKSKGLLDKIQNSTNMVFKVK